jgi:hypothetical protein
LRYRRGRTWSDVTAGDGRQEDDALVPGVHSGSTVVQPTPTIPA